MRAPTRARGLAGVLTCIVLLTSACGNASQEVLAHAVAGSVPVTFPSSDGVELAGRLFGDAARARTGIVFAHMRPADQSSWFAFADRVAGEGYLALTFDFRGYCPGGDAGCSQGEKDVSAAANDLAAAVAFLRTRGIETVAMVGASMGGTAALLVAADQGDRIAAVITLSAPQSIEGLVAGPDVLARITAAKLFVAGTGDGTAAAAAQAFSEQAQPPSRVEIVTSDDHGSDLVTGGQAEIVRTLLLTELAQYAPA